MAVTIRYHDNGQGVELVCRGVVTSRELIEANEQIYRPDAVRAQRYQIVDLSGLEGLYVSSADVARLAEQDRLASKTNPALCIAIIADRDLPYGLSRMRQAYVDQCPLRMAVFRRREDAMGWLHEQLCTVLREEEDGAARPVDPPEHK